MMLRYQATSKFQWVAMTKVRLPRHACALHWWNPVPCCFHSEFRLNEHPLSGALLDLGAEGKHRTWQARCWLWTLLPEIDIFHFPSYFTSQSTSHTHAGLQPGPREQSDDLWTITVWHIASPKCLQLLRLGYSWTKFMIFSKLVSEVGAGGHHNGNNNNICQKFRNSWSITNEPPKW